jgi:bifunctional non-homologous end joining protein LigD
VTRRPLRDRKAILADLHLAGQAWREAPWQVGGGRVLLVACEELGLEGIVAKRLDSIYRPGARSTLWRMKKCRAWLEEQLPRRIRA